MLAAALFYDNFNRAANQSTMKTEYAHAPFQKNNYRKLFCVPFYQARADLMSNTKIIRAIGSVLCRVHELDQLAYSETDLTRIGAELMEQQRLMPDYLRFPIACLTYAFDLSGIFYGGRRFHRLDTVKQLRQVQAWKSSRFGPSQNLIRFYESLFLLIALQEEAS
ncbi:MAG: hypothetical protein ACR2P6_04230 [Gammaproteobacteria bacterium]